MFKPGLGFLPLDQLRGNRLRDFAVGLCFGFCCNGGGIRLCLGLDQCHISVSLGLHLIGFSLGHGSLFFQLRDFRVLLCLFFGLHFLHEGIVQFHVDDQRGRHIDAVFILQLLVEVVRDCLVDL